VLLSVLARLTSAITVALVVAAGWTAVVGPPVARAKDATTITIEGPHLLRDGRPWTPRGVQIVGMVAPDGALSGKYVAAHQHLGAAELQAAVADHADLVRFQVSQFGIDPQGPLYSPAYVQEIAGMVQTVRDLGLAVIVSLQAEPPAGELTRCPLPDAGAQRAWNVLAAMFAGDAGVMFELYNEPGVAATLGGWIQWRDGGEIIFPSGSCQAVGMQALVDEIRAPAPDNVIIVPGLAGEQSLAGRPALVDPAHPRDPQLAYGIHYPSMTKGISSWDKAFGAAAGSEPVIVTEWDANSTTNCIPGAPAASQLLLDYLASKQIGIVGFAFDLPGTIVGDYSYAPTGYAGFVCGVAGGGPGQLLFGDFGAQAQAGDGTQPDPAPAWIVGGPTLTGLLAGGPATSRHLFNTPRTFVTGPSATTLQSLGLPAAIPTQSFSSETALAAATTDGSLPPGTAAVMYAPATSRATPRAQRRDPARYFQLAAQVTHRHGLLFVAAPSLNLVDAIVGQMPAARREAAFLRVNVAAGSARYADAFVAPAQAAETYAPGYASFTAAASAQAASAHPGIELLAGLSAGPRRPDLTGATLLDAYFGTRLVVSGYALTDSTRAHPCTSCDTGLDFLRGLERLGG
jgi:hypothetical protein